MSVLRKDIRPVLAEMIHACYLKCELETRRLDYERGVADGVARQAKLRGGAADEESKAQASEGWMMSYGPRLTGPRRASNLAAALNGFDAGWAARAASQPEGARWDMETLVLASGRRLTLHDGVVRLWNDSWHPDGADTSNSPRTVEEALGVAAVLSRTAAKVDERRGDR